MDELNLYDDLDEFHEDQEKKSKELQDLEEKCTKAMEDIQGLEEEKKVLHKKILRMELSFQSLLDTARAEIKRKDKEIERLRKEKDDICFRRNPSNRSQGPKNSTEDKYTVPPTLSKEKYTPHGNESKEDSAKYHKSESVSRTKYTPHGSETKEDSAKYHKSESVSRTRDRSTESFVGETYKRHRPQEDNDSHYHKRYRDDRDRLKSLESRCHRDNPHESDRDRDYTHRYERNKKTDYSRRERSRQRHEHQSHRRASSRSPSRDDRARSRFHRYWQRSPSRKRSSSRIDECDVKQVTSRSSKHFDNNKKSNTNSLENPEKVREESKNTGNFRDVIQVANITLNEMDLKSPKTDIVCNDIVGNFHNELNVSAKKDSKISQIPIAANETNQNASPTKLSICGEQFFSEKKDSTLKIALTKQQLEEESLTKTIDENVTNERTLCKSQESQKSVLEKNDEVLLLEEHLYENLNVENELASSSIDMKDILYGSLDFSTDKEDLKDHNDDDTLPQKTHELEAKKVYKHVDEPSPDNNGESSDQIPSTIAQKQCELFEDDKVVNKSEDLTLLPQQTHENEAEKEHITFDEPSPDNNGESSDQIPSTLAQKQCELFENDKAAKKSEDLTLLPQKMHEIEAEKGHITFDEPSPDNNGESSDSCQRPSDMAQNKCELFENDNIVNKSAGSQQNSFKGVENIFEKKYCEQKTNPTLPLSCTPRTVALCDALFGTSPSSGSSTDTNKSLANKNVDLLRENENNDTTSTSVLEHVNSTNEMADIQPSIFDLKAFEECFVPSTNKTLIISPTPMMITPQRKYISNNNCQAKSHPSATKSISSGDSSNDWVIVEESPLKKTADEIDIDSCFAKITTDGDGNNKDEERRRDDHSNNKDEEGTILGLVKQKATATAIATHKCDSISEQSDYQHLHTNGSAIGWTEEESIKSTENHILNNKQPNNLLHSDITGDLNIATSKSASNPLASNSSSSSDICNNGNDPDPDGEDMTFSTQAAEEEYIETKRSNSDNQQNETDEILNKNKTEQTYKFSKINDDETEEKKVENKKINDQTTVTNKKDNDQTTTTKHVEEEEDNRIKTNAATLFAPDSITVNMEESSSAFSLKIDVDCCTDSKESKEINEQKLEIQQKDKCLENACEERPHPQQSENENTLVADPRYEEECDNSIESTENDLPETNNRVIRPRQTIIRDLEELVLIKSKPIIMNTENENNANDITASEKGSVPNPPVHEENELNSNHSQRENNHSTTDETLADFNKSGDQQANANFGNDSENDSKTIGATPKGVTQHSHNETILVVDSSSEEEDEISVKCTENYSPSTGNKTTTMQINNDGKQDTSIIGNESISTNTEIEKVVNDITVKEKSGVQGAPVHEGNFLTSDRSQRENNHFVMTEAPPIKPDFNDSFLCKMDATGGEQGNENFKNDSENDSKTVGATPKGVTQHSHNETILVVDSSYEEEQSAKCAENNSPETISNDLTSQAIRTAKMPINNDDIKDKSVMETETIPTNTENDEKDTNDIKAKESSSLPDPTVYKDNAFNSESSQTANNHSAKNETSATTNLDDLDAMSGIKIQFASTNTENEKNTNVIRMIEKSTSPDLFSPEHNVSDSDPSQTEEFLPEANDVISNNSDKGANTENEKYTNDIRAIEKSSAPDRIAAKDNVSDSDPSQTEEFLPETNNVISNNSDTPANTENEKYTSDIRAIKKSSPPDRIAPKDNVSDSDLSQTEEFLPETNEVIPNNSDAAANSNDSILTQVKLTNHQQTNAILKIDSDNDSRSSTSPGKLSICLTNITVFDNSSLQPNEMVTIKGNDVFKTKNLQSKTVIKNCLPSEAPKQSRGKESNAILAGLDDSETMQTNEKICNESCDISASNESAADLPAASRENSKLKPNQNIKTKKSAAELEVPNVVNKKVITWECTVFRNTRSKGTNFRSKCINMVNNDTSINIPGLSLISSEDVEIPALATATDVVNRYSKQLTSPLKNEPALRETLEMVADRRLKNKENAKKDADDSLYSNCNELSERNDLNSTSPITNVVCPSKVLNETVSRSRKETPQDKHTDAVQLISSIGDSEFFENSDHVTEITDPISQTSQQTGCSPPDYIPGLDLLQSAENPDVSSTTSSQNKSISRFSTNYAGGGGSGSNIESMESLIVTYIPPKKITGTILIPGLGLLDTPMQRGKSQRKSPNLISNLSVETQKTNENVVARQKSPLPVDDSQKEKSTKVTNTMKLAAEGREQESSSISYTVPLDECQRRSPNLISNFSVESQKSNEHCARQKSPSPVDDSQEEKTTVVVNTPELGAEAREPQRSSISYTEPLEVSQRRSPNLIYNISDESQKSNEHIVARQKSPLTTDDYQKEKSTEVTSTRELGAEESVQQRSSISYTDSLEVSHRRSPNLIYNISDESQKSNENVVARQKSPLPTHDSQKEKTTDVLCTPEMVTEESVPQRNNIFCTEPSTLWKLKSVIESVNAKEKESQRPQVKNPTSSREMENIQNHINVTNAKFLPNHNQTSMYLSCKTSANNSKFNEINNNPESGNSKHLSALENKCQEENSVVQETRADLIFTSNLKISKENVLVQDKIDVKPSCCQLNTATIKTMLETPTSGKATTTSKASESSPLLIDALNVYSEVMSKMTLSGKDTTSDKTFSEFDNIISFERNLCLVEKSSELFEKKNENLKNLFDKHENSLMSSPNKFLNPFNVTAPKTPKSKSAISSAKTNSAMENCSFPNNLPSVSTKCPTPPNFSGIFSKISRTDTTYCNEHMVYKIRSPHGKTFIIPAASVLCNVDNLQIAAKASKKLHWELLDNKNEIRQYEDDAHNSDVEEHSRKEDLIACAKATSMKGRKMHKLNVVSVAGKPSEASATCGKPKLPKDLKRKKFGIPKRRNTGPPPLSDDTLEQFRQLAIRQQPGVTKKLAGNLKKSLPSSKCDKTNDLNGNLQQVVLSPTVKKKRGRPAKQNVIVEHKDEEMYDEVNAAIQDEGERLTDSKATKQDVMDYKQNVMEMIDKNQSHLNPKGLQSIPQFFKPVQNSALKNYKIPKLNEQDNSIKDEEALTCNSSLLPKVPRVLIKRNCWEEYYHTAEICQKSLVKPPEEEKNCTNTVALQERAKHMFGENRSRTPLPQYESEKMSLNKIENQMFYNSTQTECYKEEITFKTSSPVTIMNDNDYGRNTHTYVNASQPRRKSMYSLRANENDEPCGGDNTLGRNLRPRRKSFYSAMNSIKADCDEENSSLQSSDETTKQNAIKKRRKSAVNLQRRRIVGSSSEEENDYKVKAKLKQPKIIKNYDYQIKENKHKSKIINDNEMHDKNTPPAETIKNKLSTAAVALDRPNISDNENDEKLYDQYMQAQHEFLRLEKLVIAKHRRKGSLRDSESSHSETLNDEKTVETNEAMTKTILMETETCPMLDDHNADTNRIQSTKEQQQALEECTKSVKAKHPSKNLLKNVQKEKCALTTITHGRKSKNNEINAYNNANDHCSDNLDSQKRNKMLSNTATRMHDQAGNLRNRRKSLHTQNVASNDRETAREMPPLIAFNKSKTCEEVKVDSNAENIKSIAVKSNDLLNKNIICELTPIKSLRMLKKSRANAKRSPPESTKIESEQKLHNNDIASTKLNEEEKALNERTSIKDHSTKNDDKQQVNKFHDQTFDSNVFNTPLKYSKTKNLNRRIVDNTDSECEEIEKFASPPQVQTVIADLNNKIDFGPVKVTTAALRKRRIVKVLSTSLKKEEEKQNQMAIKFKSTPNECDKSISGSPSHPIFYTQVSEQTSLNMTALSSDDRYNEMDSELRDMFQSPQYETDSVVVVPAIKDSCKSVNTEVTQIQTNNISKSLILDETIVCTNQENDATSFLNDSKSLNSSVASPDKSTAKHLSLGTTDYRFEKVSENVVNLFISRKRKRRNKPPTTN